jgi:hypothetical protein
MWGNLRRALQWGSLALLAVFCVYRVATFRLLPLDSPGTFHAMLWPLLARFRAAHVVGPSAEYTWIYYGWVLLLLTASLALLNFCVERGILPLWPRGRWILCSRWLFFFSTAVCLAIWRFPLVLGGGSNPDEPHMIALSTKLLVDPVFFRAVDANTSGPFNIFPLTVPALLGLSPDYATTRTIALVLIFLSLYVLHRAMRVMGSDELGRVAILPAVGFFSLATYPDFVHYSSELVPLLLTSLAVLACVRTIQDPRDYMKPLLGLGLLVSIAFFAKMQCVPIVAAASLVAGASVYLSGHARRSWRPILLLAAGFAPIQILNFLILAATGQLRNFWLAYISANWNYSQPVSFFSDINALAPTIMATRDMHFLVVALLVPVTLSVYVTLRGDREPEWLRLLGVLTITAITVGGLVQFRNLAQPETYKLGCTVILSTAAVLTVFLVVKGFLRDRQVGMFGILAATLLAASLFAVHAPHRLFAHYLELLIVPISTAIGWLLIRSTGNVTGTTSRKGRYRGLSIVLFLILVTVGGEYSLVQNVGYNFGSAQETLALPAGRLIDSLNPSGSGIVVWGWCPEIYLSSGRVPATRDGNIGLLFAVGKGLNLRYQDRFLGDLKRSRAGLIVDALEVSCCNLNDRKVYGFEQLPAINSYIQAHYVLVAEKYRERFYLRRDLAGKGNAAENLM